MLTYLRYYGIGCVLLMTGCQHVEYNGSPAPASATVADKGHGSFVTALPSPLSDSQRDALPKTVSFSQAQAFVLAHSHTLQAERAGLRAKQLQARALDDLHQPAVFLSGAAGRYNVEVDISTAALKDRLKGYGQELSGGLQALVGQLPPQIAQALSGLPSSDALINQIPTNIHLKKQDDFQKANISAVMPVYSGGRIDAIQEYAQGRVDLQASTLDQRIEDVQLTLVKRYFGVQLARKALAVRKKALRAVAAHDHAAQRMLTVGLISRSERLQGSAALSEARLQVQKAENQLRLAQRSLDSMLQGAGKKTLTSLFVSHKKLASLAYFQQQARLKHPVFATIAAKSRQAQASKSLSDANWKPQVTAFGMHELTGGADDWVVGVNASWQLHSSIDRSDMQDAAQASLAQVSAVEMQAAADINLLIEKYWLAVNDAVKQFDTLAHDQKLAREVVSLRAQGFKNGINTIIELNDAEARLSKVRTERAQASYAYVVALAELLLATGQFDTFADYQQRADTRW